MPRAVRERLSASRELTPVSTPASTRVVARPVDQAVLAPQSQLSQLVAGLTSVQPTLARYFQQREAEQDRQDEINGQTDAQLGREKASESEKYVHGYMKIKGGNTAYEDLAEFQERMASEFNPDTDDFDAFAQGFLKEKAGGLNDRAYLEGYAPVLDAGLSKLKGQYFTERRQNLVDNQQAEALKSLSLGMKYYVDRGEPVPEEFLQQKKAELADYFKTSGSEFNALQFQVAKEFGDQGNWQIYEQFKRNRPDGTPGMYYIPEWKEKIDAAEIYAKTRFVQIEAAAQKAANEDRSKRQEEALAPIFTEALTGGYNEAAAKFKELVASNPGMFSASEISEYTGKFSSLSKASQLEDTEAQQEAATYLLADIYRGRANIKSVLDAVTNKRISYNQGQQLLNDVNAFNTSQRTLAAAEASDSGRIYKTPQFQAGEEYLKKVLTTTLPSSIDPMGTGSSFDKQQRATAILEFTQRASKVSDPAELDKIRDEIADRYLKRMRDPNINSQGDVAGRLSFSTPAEAAAAYRAGKLSEAGLQMHFNYFTSQNKRTN